jgi:hypothetical protein
VEGLSVLSNRMGNVVVQAPCQHLSWQLGILKDQFCFSFLLSKIIYLRNEVLYFAQKEGDSLGEA